MRYDAQVFEELLWVWPASGPEEHIHAAAKRPNATAELGDLPPGTEVHTVSKWFQRDLPYDWTVRGTGGLLLGLFLDCCQPVKLTPITCSGQQVMQMKLQQDR